MRRVPRGAFPLAVALPAVAGSGVPGAGECSPPGGPDAVGAMAVGRRCLPWRELLRNAVVGRSVAGYGRRHSLQHYCYALGFPAADRIVR